MTPLRNATNVYSLIEFDFITKPGFLENERLVGVGEAKVPLIMNSTVALPTPTSSGTLQTSSLLIRIGLPDLPSSLATLVEIIDTR